MNKTQDLSMISNKVGSFDTYKDPKAGKDDDDANSLPTPTLEHFLLLLFFFPQATNAPK